jgi:hypothetical protein
MLLNLKQLTGHKLSATDGDIGHVRDFYLDDNTWAVRYVVADTGNWLTGRLVLFSPYAFGRFEPEAKALPVCLTKKQIENCPPIDTHRPVSRQYEENYYRYYGWPAYWQGGSVWGATDYPVPAMMPAPPPESFGVYEYDRWDDIHLRSAKTVQGYHLEATDGPIGTVSGFMLDDKKWKIHELLVETGHWYAGKEIRLNPGQIQRISYPESKVYVNITKAQIQHTVENAVAQSAA